MSQHATRTLQRLPRYRFLLKPDQVPAFRQTVAAENAERRRGRPDAIAAAFVGPPEPTTFGGVIAAPLYYQTVRVESHEAALWLTMRWTLVQCAQQAGEEHTNDDFHNDNNS